jgi:hypothetical protein
MNLNQPVIEAITVDNIFRNDGIVIVWFLVMAIVTTTIALWSLWRNK